MLPNPIPRRQFCRASRYWQYGLVLAIATMLVTYSTAQPPQDRGGPPGGFGGPGAAEDLEILDRFDKNSDGWLNLEERAEARKFLKENPAPARGGRRGRGGGRPQGGPGEMFDPSAIFEMEDKNADGKLTREEVRNSPMANDFAEIDANRDGSITQKEFNQHAQSMFLRGQGRRGQNGERGGPPGFGGGPPAFGGGPPGFGGGPPGFGGGRPGRGGNREPAKPGIKISPDDVKPQQGELYDTSVLRTIFIDFENKDWESELEAFHNTDVEVPATLTVDGEQYPLCGIRFRGNSSYMMVPTGYKRSFNVSVDMANEDQRLMGYKTLNLLNGAGDDTLLSTVLYSHLISQHSVAPKANFVRVVVNGENWGIFTNAQQFNKDLLREHYTSAKGTRWKVSGSPRGNGGLDYRGPDVASYGFPYKIKDGGEKATKKLIELCRVMEEVPAEQLPETIEKMVDIEELLWFLAYDIALCNSDGYWIRASDYSIFLDKKDKFHFMPHDMNEAFRGASGRGGQPGGRGRPRRQVEDQNSSGLDPLMGMNDSSKPLRSKILAVPKYRDMYMDNLRTIAEELKWENMGPTVSKYRNLIQKEVRKDTKKLGTYDNFLALTSKNVPRQSNQTGRQGRGGHGAENLRKFCDERSAYLSKVTSSYFESKANSGN